MRKAHVYFVYIGINLLLLSLVLAHALYARETAIPFLHEKSELVRTLKLTDLCLFTDARYTRNPAVADFHSAFSDAPMAFDHFPSSSLMEPPPHLRNMRRDEPNQ
jgi:hypothetical protein